VLKANNQGIHQLLPAIGPVRIKLLVIKAAGSAVRRAVVEAPPLL
jgi:hypothetical protein